MALGPRAASEAERPGVGGARSCERMSWGTPSWLWPGWHDGDDGPVRPSAIVRRIRPRCRSSKPCGSCWRLRRPRSRPEVSGRMDCCGRCGGSGRDWRPALDEPSPGPSAPDCDPSAAPWPTRGSGDSGERPSRPGTANLHQSGLTVLSLTYVWFGLAAVESFPNNGLRIQHCDRMTG